jgi:hypothetical protein
VVELAAHREPPPGWEHLARELGTFYHDHRWVTGLARCFRFEASFLAATESGSLVGGLPLLRVPGLLGRARLVSLPFSYAAGPIARSADAARALLEDSTRLARERGVRRVEIKQANPPWDAARGFVRNVHYHAYRLDTSGSEGDIFKRLHKSSTQRGIRKAEKSGVNVRVGTSHHDWLEMALLQESTSHRHGVPAPPRGFFLVLCKALQQVGLAELYVAEVPERGVAAAIVVWKGPRDWIYAFGASRDELLEYRPNHALLWRAIRDAAAAGIVFDFGRAAPEQKGLVEFKRRWGGEPVPLAYDYWPGAGGLNVARRDQGALGAAARVWSALPAPIARVGSALYRYLG